MAVSRATYRRRRLTVAASVATGVLLTVRAVIGASPHAAAASHVPAPRPAAARPAVAHTAPAVTAGTLAPGSDPSVLPGPVLIADKLNNRLLLISPGGAVLWQFPSAGSLPPGVSFRIPDDAFFSRDGRYVVATEEDDFVISVLDARTGRLLWRFGTPGVHGSGLTQLWNPDDAMMLPDGTVLAADIKNCRIVQIARDGSRIVRQLGHTGWCAHRAPADFASPNGVFPARDGNWLVTEINGAWVEEIGPGGTPLWSVHPPGVRYPSDTNQIGPDSYLTVDYSSPGQVVVFSRTGSLQWRWAQNLDHPSIAIGLPNGDLLVSDDWHHRVFVVDPRTDRIRWQYGHTGVAGSAPGWLDNPDGVDLAPPYSLLQRAPGPLVPP